MNSTPRRVVITGAARGLGRALAFRFAEAGDELVLSSRDGAGAQRVCEELRARGFERIHPFSCDLTKADSIRAFSTKVGKDFGGVDILINNGAAWLEGDIDTATDEEIINVISSGATGAVLMVKHFLPLLRASVCPDIVNIISSAALPNTDDCAGHIAFYAAKGGQGRLAETLSIRLRPAGIRVISLYPPTFDDFDPLAAVSDRTPSADDRLTGESIVECVMFAVAQPRNCFIRKFEFESI